MATNLKTLIAALKASDNIETIMGKARIFWKVKANDTDYARAAKTPKASITWIMEETDKARLTQFLELCDKKGYLDPAEREPVEKPTRTRAPTSAAAAAKIGRAKAKPAKATKSAPKGRARPDTYEPREGSKLAQTIDMMSTKRGATKEAIEEAIGAGVPLWSLKQRGYVVENIGERGSPIYRIVA